MNSTDPFWAVIVYLCIAIALAVIFKLMGVRHYVVAAVTVAVIMAMVVYAIITT